ncbi:MAG: hypothetical protein II943_01200 [Victivallales bacterium]|nr:hypothetical protein [Victivallales bacterium]
MNGEATFLNGGETSLNGGKPTIFPICRTDYSCLNGKACIFLERATPGTWPVADSGKPASLTAAFPLFSRKMWKSGKLSAAFRIFAGQRCFAFVKIVAERVALSAIPSASKNGFRRKWARSNPHFGACVRRALPVTHGVLKSPPDSPSHAENSGRPTSALLTLRETATSLLSRGPQERPVAERSKSLPFALCILWGTDICRAAVMQNRRNTLPQMAHTLFRIAENILSHVKFTNLALCYP